MASFFVGEQATRDALKILGQFEATSRFDAARALRDAIKNV